MERHKLHPRNYPGCPSFRDRTKHKRQLPVKGTWWNVLLTIYFDVQHLLKQWLFAEIRTPDLGYLECQSNHSATVANKGGDGGADVRVYRDGDGGGRPWEDQCHRCVQY